MLEFGKIVAYDGLYYKIVGISDDETPTYTLEPVRRKTENLQKTVITTKKQHFLVPAGTRISGVAGTGLTEIGDRTAMSKTLEDGIFRLKFESNGGSEVAPQYIAEDGKATAPTDPTLEGFTFEGWFYDDEDFVEAMDFDNDTFDDDVILYAKWAEVEGE